MIYIICGENNQGKTAKISSLYSKNNKGDGFITRKLFRDSLFCGYELVRLSTGDSAVQSLKRELFPSDEIPFLNYGPFSFFQKGFELADSTIDDIIAGEIDPVFIDEIGPIELNGYGHHDCFKKIIDTDRTIYVTVRNRCIDDVISYFSLKKFTLIKI